LGSQPLLQANLWLLQVVSQLLMRRPPLSSRKRLPRLQHRPIKILLLQLQQTKIPLPLRHPSKNLLFQHRPIKILTRLHQRTKIPPLLLLALMALYRTTRRMLLTA
jgi:hypothetical protein